MGSASLPSLDGLGVEELKALLVCEREQHRAEQSSNIEEVRHLKLMIEKLRRQLFGTKSEKGVAQLEQLELGLEDLETTQAVEEMRIEAPVANSADSRMKPHRKPLPECDGKIEQFGEDIAEQLERIPAVFKVIRHVRPKFACVHYNTVRPHSSLGYRPLAPETWMTSTTWQHGEPYPASV